MKNNFFSYPALLAPHLFVVISLWRQAVPYVNGVSVELRLKPSLLGHPAEPTVQGPPIQDDGVLNIVAWLTHNCHARIMASRQLILIDQLDGLRPNQWGLGVHQHLKHRVHPIQLPVPHYSQRLLAHWALIGVSRTLIVMRPGNEAGHTTKNGQRVDFKMRKILAGYRLRTQRNQCVVFLVDVQLLDQTAPHKIVENHLSGLQLLHVLLLKFRHSVFKNYQGTR